MTRDLLFWHAFNLIPQVGAKRLRIISNHFKDLKTAWSAPLEDFVKAGLPRKIAREISHVRLAIDPRKEFKKVLDLGIDIVTIKDKRYPELLKEIYSPPALLYVKGRLIEQDNLALAVVGTRKMSEYGKMVVKKIIGELTASGLTIVSGLALGVDAQAHHETINAGGRTIAVLGSGVDDISIYPRHNLNLAKKVISSGALISEYPPGTESYPQHFPVRNRIISGMTKGTLVVEAAKRSGALITAYLALDQNREVFAIPGDITRTVSMGPNDLIKRGAKAVLAAADILAELDLNPDSDYTKEQGQVLASDDERAILGHLSDDPIHIDKLEEITRMPPGKLSSLLSTMEVKGLIKNIGAQNYITS